MTLLRSLAFAAWLYLWLVLLGLIYAVPTLLHRDAGWQAVRLWARAALFGLRWIVGARVALEGVEKAAGGGPYLVAMKHQSMLDTLVLALLFARPAVVLKRELLRAPIFGVYAKRLGMIAVDRDAQAAALKSMLKAAREAIAQRRDIVIFPEGTRTEIGAPPDYKIGVAALYRDLGVPCLPVALDTGLIWASRGVVRRSGQATIKVLDPIPPGLPRDAFMQALESRIEGETALLVARDRKT